ncbi:hypothetical protein AZI86_18810 [Bdellovibrio bacteriovorus]|uniref:Outer membrane protein beta-barrel domain-containing protein n=1 Tax=Bdellovibrio bacteriovorus TaxID=959 RepID=A0A150WDR0_BDEBC|nr:hypothetical protein [Bdellovibrio bacteriovorus]KYG60968.1 hypothetical protein AZI86_18810 [Bdellovibrio bacteriovorus]
MSLTKVLSLIFVFLFALPSWAQEGSSSSAAEEIHPELKKNSSNWGLSISSLSWNDKLKLRQGITSDTDYANYNSFIVTVQKEFNLKRWGYSVGLFGGVGQANGGGNSTTITYLKSKVNYSVFGVSPRVFYRMSERIALGTSALVFSRIIDWPVESGTTIDAGRNINATILADINLRIFNKWDLYQGVGPLAEGATMWKLGVNYRF